MVGAGRPVLVGTGSPVLVGAGSPVLVGAGSPVLVDAGTPVFVDADTPGSDDEVPMATRRPRGRKRAIAVEDVSTPGKGGASVVQCGTPPSCHREPQRSRKLFPSSIRDDHPDPGFTTPVRPLTQRCLSLMKPERSRPRSSAAGSFYSPLSRFLTPSKESEWLKMPPAPRVSPKDVRMRVLSTSAS